MAKDQLPVQGNTSDVPRYIWLRDHLMHGIHSGKYPVGSLLPPEHELARTFGLSRHTVREATRRLVDNGYISRQPGVGTIVNSTQPRASGAAGMGTATNLLEYARQTRLQVLASRDIRADEELAATLGCAVDDPWHEVDALRFTSTQPLPIAFTKVYLRPEVQHLAERLRGHHKSILEMLQQDEKREIHHLKQLIEGTLMPAHAARLLEVRPRSAGLLLRRSMIDANGVALAITSNYYTAERFCISVSWSRDAPDDNGPMTAGLARDSATPATPQHADGARRPRTAKIPQ